MTTLIQADRVIDRKGAIGGEARLSWLLAGIAGMVGAVAFLHSAGYFVTFMTGNTTRAVVAGYPVSETQRVAGAGAVAATSLLVAFLVGVFVASYCRRRFWRNHPHGATVLTTVGLLAASGLDFALDGFVESEVRFVPILLITFSIGALNTSFVKNGEVSVPLSYVTGTLVKLAQGLERHLCGRGSVFDWLGYAALCCGFVGGAVVGGAVASVLTGPQVILATGLLCGSVTVVTFFHADRRTLLG